jgi:hypothetical protein
MDLQPGLNDNTISLMITRILPSLLALGLLSASTVLPVLHDWLHHRPVDSHHHHHHGHEHAHSHSHEPRDGFNYPGHGHAHDAASCTLCQSTLIALSPDCDLAKGSVAEQVSVTYDCRAPRGRAIRALARGPPGELALPFSLVT